MHRTHAATCCFLGVTLLSQLAHAVSSAELYTAAAYSYGRVETRLRFAAGDGVVSSFFLWKDGSEKAGTFWNELDFEKLNAECRLETNPIYGNPSANHNQRHPLELDLCGSFHTYTYEWTPEALVWFVDGQEIRRDTGAAAQAYADNAGTLGMQIHFNLWPGDASFGGNFDPVILPTHQYIDWVTFAAYENGEFKPMWREDFDGTTLPAEWLTGTWASPKNKSTHAPENVNFIDGYAVLSLTADDALGPAGAMPLSSGGGGASSGGAPAGGGGTSSGGSSTSAGSPSSSGAGQTAGGAATGGTNGTSTAGAPAAGSSNVYTSSGAGCSFGGSARTRGGSAALGLALLMGWLTRRRAR